MILYRTRFNQKKHPNRREFYYGVHKGGDNSYLGSGKILKDYIKKYGRDSFIRDTIYEGDDAYELEKMIVDEQMLSNPDCLNYKLGGEGGWDHITDWSYMSKVHKGVPKSKEHRNKIGKGNLGNKRPDLSLMNIRNGRRCVFDGIEYESVTEAYRVTGVNRKRITKQAIFL